MSTQRTVENISAEEFEQVVDQFIEQAATWDGALPLETFFDAWDDLADKKESLEVQALLVEGELILETPPESPLTARGNHIWLEDGRELIIRLHLPERPFQNLGQ